MKRVCKLECERNGLEVRLRALSDENEQLRAELYTSRAEAESRAAEVSNLQTQTRVLMGALQDVVGQQQPLQQLQQQRRQVPPNRLLGGPGPQAPARATATHCMGEVACSAGTAALHGLEPPQLEVVRTVEMLSRRRDKLRARLIEVEAAFMPGGAQAAGSAGSGGKAANAVEHGEAYDEDARLSASSQAAAPLVEAWAADVDGRSEDYQAPEVESQVIEGLPWQHSTPRARLKPRAPVPPSLNRERDRSNSYFQSLGIQRSRLEEASRTGR